MSLQVWLPLTKDLRQQGLLNTTATAVGGTTSFVAGKLGQALSCNGSTYWSIPNITLSTSASIACWCKTTVGSKMPWVLESDANNKLNFYWASIYTLNTGDSNNNPFQTDGGANISVLTDGAWHHFVVTFGNSIAKLYIDGEYAGKAKTFRNPTTTNKPIKLAGGYNGGHSYDWNGAINDFRVYDHCLSSMEVKELAKGLVLHYPLNRQGWGQENLLPGSYRADGNTTNRIYGWQANGNGAPEIVNINGTNCIHLQASCTGKYIPSIVSASKVFLEYGIEYTISCDLKFDKDITVTNSTPIHYHSGSSNSTDEFNTANINNGHGFNFKSISPAAGTTIPANTWQHYEQHIIAKTAPTDSSLPYLTYRAFIYGSVRTVSETATVNMWLKNWKIEKGSIATPWCPNSSDTLATTMGLNSTTEYDCSGFCNNGTRTGTFSWTSDTPKYNVSTVFSGSQRIEAPWNPSGTTSFTIAGWFYNSSGTTYYGAKNTYNTYICLEQSRYFVYNSGGSAYVGNYTSARNTWQHIILVHDATTMKLKLYINGSFVSEVTTNGTIYNSDILDIGGRQGAAQYNGKISDFRIYATALSADDVKSLYQNCATIDPDGTIRGQIRN